MDQTVVGGLVVLIIALCQFLKNLTFVNSRYIPLIAILLGVLGSFAVGGVAWTQVAGGVLMGLSSVGLYSGFKATVLNQ
jgi:hypothetical protein